MAKAYYGNKLSPNIIQTAEGFLICKNVPIARTGVQQYLGREIGIDDKYNDVINVYRLEDEVFAPRVFASFEGKPFVDEHPSDWVVPGNAQTYLKGVVTNVRRGAGKESDLLLSDILVYDPIVIEEIQGKQKREVSCGYECEYVPYKDGYAQRSIVGNHVALVSAGRAGARVAIKDNAIKEKEKVVERRKTIMRLPRKGGASDFMKALGLKTFAQDAEPDEVMEAVDEMVNEKFEEQQKDEEMIKTTGAEPENTITDEDIEEVKSQVAEVKDAIMSMLTADEGIEEIVEVDDEDLEDVEEGMDALNDLIEDACAEDYDVVEEVESITEPAEEITEDNEETSEVASGIQETSQITSDDITELAKVLKPIIASIENPRQRKRVSDNLAKVLKKHKKKAVDSNKSIYSNLARKSVSDSKVSDNKDIGMEIAKKFNPHYKENK